MTMNSKNETNDNLIIGVFNISPSPSGQHEKEFFSPGEIIRGYILKNGRQSPIMQDFIIANPKNYSFPVSQIRINGKSYHAVEVIKDIDEIETIFESRNMNFNQILNNSWVKQKGSIDEIVESFKNYEEVKLWAKQINEISDGYKESFSQELEHIYEHNKKLVIDLYNKMISTVTEEYFDYEDSTVEDLSVVDGIRCFQWAFSYDVFQKCYNMVDEFVEKINK